MTAYGYSKVFRDFISSSSARDRQRVVEDYGGLDSPALDALVAELAACPDEPEPPRSGRHYSTQMTAWINSADADLATAIGRCDMHALDLATAPDKPILEGGEFHREALDALRWEWIAYLTLAHTAAEEAASIGLLGPLGGCLDDPRGDPVDDV